MGGDDITDANNKSALPATYIEGFHDLETVSNMEYRMLGRTGLRISKLSYGVSAIGSVFRATNDAESADVVEYFIKNGVNWIDAAPWYGHGKAETVFGQAVKAKNIPRKSYYLSTKVGRYSPDRSKMFDFSAKRTTQSIDESLARLGTDYVDLIQIHDMEFAPSIDVILNETLPALQKAKDDGKARFIGITGFPLENFRIVLERSTVQIDTIMTYCRYCLNDTGLVDDLSYFKDRGIGVLSASANAMGLLTTRPPPDWHPASAASKLACQQAVRYCQDVGVDISRLAVHFSSSNDDVHTCMISTASMANARANLQAATEPLNEYETVVLEYIRKKYFEPLHNDNWGWQDVSKHFDKIRRDMLEQDEHCDTTEVERRIADPALVWGHLE